MEDSTASCENISSFSDVRAAIFVFSTLISSSICCAAGAVVDFGVPAPRIEGCKEGDVVLKFKNMKTKKIPIKVRLNFMSRLVEVVV